jgi:hypothetical protein
MERCPNTSDGKHCFHPSHKAHAVPAIDPPEGGWPKLQECTHCGQERWRKVEVRYEYEPR